MVAHMSRRESCSTTFLQKVPLETFYAIGAQLGPRDLSSLCRCSKGFFQIFGPMLYRQIEISHKFTSSPSEFLRYTRRLDIRLGGTGQPGPKLNKKHESIEDVFPYFHKMTENLRCLTWEGNRTIGGKFRGWRAENLLGLILGLPGLERVSITMNLSGQMLNRPIHNVQLTELDDFSVFNVKTSADIKIITAISQNITIDNITISFLEKVCPDVLESLGQQQCPRTLTVQIENPNECKLESPLGLEGLTAQLQTLKLINSEIRPFINLQNELPCLRHLEIIDEHNRCHLVDVLAFIEGASKGLEVLRLELAISSQQDQDDIYRVVGSHQGTLKNLQILQREGHSQNYIHDILWDAQLLKTIQLDCYCTSWPMATTPGLDQLIIQPLGSEYLSLLANLQTVKFITVQKLNFLPNIRSAVGKWIATWSISSTEAPRLTRIYILNRVDLPRLFYETAKLAIQWMDSNEHISRAPGTTVVWKPRVADIIEADYVPHVG
ncbi:hypothetical protein TWF217_003187 [Orbilia oligospora]|nr:hypothetical protein TWF217_003187 [Orbilia oligospora]